MLKQDNTYHGQIATKMRRKQSTKDSVVSKYRSFSTKKKKSKTKCIEKYITLLL